MTFLCRCVLQGVFRWQRRLSIGIEEPENFLHPRLIPELAEECRAATEGSQLLATTHSPFFVNALQPEEVRVMYRGEDGYAKTIRASDIQGVREFVAAGASLGHLWMENRFGVGDPLVRSGGLADPRKAKWLRGVIRKVFPSVFETILVQKARELVAAPFRFDGSRGRAQAFFQEGLGQAFRRMLEEQEPGYPLTVYYAFKQSESGDSDDEEDEAPSAVASTGWETMLEGLLTAGFSIHGTWPARSERAARTRSIGSNALASSIVLVCRPRPADAPITTRRDFTAALRRELPPAVDDLTLGGIAPVDLAQASIGPGMAIFSRHVRVLEPNGTPMSVRTALQLINQVLDEHLAAQEGEMDRDTRFCVAWYEQHGHDEGLFGDAETLSKAKNTAVAGLVDAGILASRAGKVRLLERSELPGDWDPKTDSRLTTWECVQHLIRILNERGSEAAGDLVRQLGSRAEDARTLAYRLYNICDRKGWAEEALAYNGLVLSWSALREIGARPASGGQGVMSFTYESEE